MNARRAKRIKMPKRGGGPNIGNRCKGEQMPCCAICDSWAFKDRVGRFPRSFDELRGLV